MLYTNPLYVNSITEDDRYVVVETNCHLTLRCKKTLGRTLKGLSVGQVYQFGAFEPWNPYEWFVEFKPVEWKERNIKVYNKPKKSFISLLTKLAVEFWSREENMNQMNTTESVIISYIPFPKHSNALATYSKIRWTNKSLIMINDSLDVYNILDSLFHELTHLSQVLNNRLDQSNTKWDNVWVDTNKVSYRDLPWEIDARAKAAELTNKFLKQIDVRDIAINY